MTSASWRIGLSALGFVALAVAPAIAQRPLTAEQRIAMAEIRQTAADLAIRAAARLVKTSMSEQQQRQIVQDFLGDLPDASTKTVQ